MAVFYSSSGCLFHVFVSPGCRDGFFSFRLLLIHSEVEEIVHWMAEILLAAEISFGGQHRCVSQSKLNLFEFAAV